MRRLILAIVVGIITGIVVYLIGVALALVSPVATLGAVLQSLAWVFGILSALWYYLTGQSL